MTDKLYIAIRDWSRADGAMLVGDVVYPALDFSAEMTIEIDNVTPADQGGEDHDADLR